MFDISPMTGFPNLYNEVNKKLLSKSSVMIVIVSVILVGYYVLFYSLGQPTGAGQSLDLGASNSQTANYGFSLIELILWGLFIFLILTNGLQYFFSLDIKTAIKNIFTEPQVDIDVSHRYDEEVPEIMIEKQVFNIPENDYTYDEAKALCHAYGAKLATYDQIKEAYDKGAEWCNYGWSEGQMAFFPTQKKTFDKLQKKKGHEQDCGRVGINGGYIANPNVKFGVNCYGYKPDITPEESEKMGQITPYPLTKEEKEMQMRVNKYKKQLPEILISPFNNTRWSQM